MLSVVWVADLRNVECEVSEELDCGAAMPVRGVKQRRHRRKVNEVDDGHRVGRLESRNRENRIRVGVSAYLIDGDLSSQSTVERRDPGPGHSIGSSRGR